MPSAAGPQRHTRAECFLWQEMYKHVTQMAQAGHKCSSFLHLQSIIHTWQRERSSPATGVTDQPAVPAPKDGQNQSNGQIATRIGDRGSPHMGGARYSAACIVLRGGGQRVNRCSQSQKWGGEGT